MLRYLMRRYQVVSTGFPERIGREEGIICETAIPDFFQKPRERGVGPRSEIQNRSIAPQKGSDSFMYEGFQVGLVAGISGIVAVLEVSSFGACGIGEKSAIQPDVAASQTAMVGKFSLP